jgi:hypothetical protein
MTTIPKPLRTRFKEHLINAQDQIINAEKNHVESKEDLLNIFKYISCHIFGFNEQTELIDLSISDVPYFYLGVKTENKIKYIIEIVPPGSNFNTEDFAKTVEYTISNNIEWFSRTNGIFWETYRNRCKQADEYGQEQVRESTFNLL